jgi:threonine dehydrogenase-like Zn-dependent dehydrogenase
VTRAPLKKSAHGFILGGNRIAELTLRVLRTLGFTNVTSGSGAPESEFEFVIETLATEASLSACLGAVRPRGIVVLRSRPFASVPLDVGLCVAKEVTLHALSYGSFEEAMALIASGALGLAELRGEPAPLWDFARVFAEAEQSQAHKQVFAISREGQAR